MKYKFLIGTSVVILLLICATIPVVSQDSSDANLNPAPARVIQARSDNQVPGKLYMGPSTRLTDGDASSRFNDYFLEPDAVIAVQPVPEPPSETHFKWRIATQESLLFTGIQHAYNLGTEAGTRDALNGHWFQDYVDSVGELRGWSDGDKFMAPYVGHTIEGSVFGFIERQNEPKYRDVQLGDGRDYFISLLHSLAYAAVWHTQWKIGPISEASIGNVMLHASPGFITLTNTPTLGTVAMFGEDACDRYLLMGLENRTANRAIIILARSFLNPGRTMANMMAFKLPWHRETRIGVMGQNFRLRQQLLAEYKRTGEKPFQYIRPENYQGNFERTYPKEAPIELSAFPVYEKFIGSKGCIGGGGSGASRIDPQWQVLAEVSGCLLMGWPASNQSGDSLYYGGGFRWTPRAAHHISPYMQVMLGGRKVTHEVDDLALRKKLFKEWDNGDGTLPHYPKRSDWSVESATNGPDLGVGGGFDVILARAFAWRVLDLQYSHSWIGDVGGVQPQNAIRISMGAVLRIGTW
jgi:hypothetical protein